MPLDAAAKAPDKDLANGCISAAIWMEGGSKVMHLLVERELYAYTALPRLKVCAGKVEPTAAARTDLWAVAVGDDGYVELNVTPTPSGTAPKCYALRPLYPQRVSREAVTIVRRARDGGNKDQSDVRNADVDVWARTFVDDLDTFLCAAHAITISDAAPAEWQQALQAKQSLAAAIAAGLADLYDVAPSASLDAARDGLARQLTVSLGAGATMDVMLQYAVRTQAPTGQANVRVSVLPCQTTMLGASRATLTGSAIDFKESASFLSITASILPGDDSFIDLELAPSVSEVEFTIGPVADGAYGTPEWLSFVSALTAGVPPPGWQVALGAPRVPVPIRSFPTSPLPLAQTTRPDPQAAPGWAGAPYWQYQMRFCCAPVPQDQLIFGAVFNPVPVPPPTPGNAELFEALANYQANRASIWQDIDGADVASGATDFANAATAIAEAWTRHWNLEARDARIAALFEVGRVTQNAPQATTEVIYCGTLQHADHLYRALDVEAIRTADDIIRWPDITVTDGDFDHLLVPLPAEGSRRRYVFPPTATIRVGAAITFGVAVGTLHIARYQEVAGAMAVVRNARLLGIDGPTTSEDFVYRAPPAVFPTTIAPYLTFAAPFAAGSWDADDPSSLDDILAALLTDRDAMLTTVSVEARSGSAAISPALPLRLPMFFVPQANYPGTLANDLTTQVNAWATAWLPRAGSWEFSVTAYSTLTDRPDEPLLVVELVFTTCAPN